MNEEAASQASRLDKQLNAEYDAILAALPEADATRLRQAERAWVVYRDLNCAAEQGLYEGGSIAPTIHLACLSKVTRDRIAEIERIYAEQLR